MMTQKNDLELLKKTYLDAVKKLLADAGRNPELNDDYYDAMLRDVGEDVQSRRDRLCWESGSARRLRARHVEGPPGAEEER